MTCVRRLKKAKCNEKEELDMKKKRNKKNKVSEIMKTRKKA